MTLIEPEWTNILPRLLGVIITLRCWLCCHSDRKSMWRKQMWAAAYVIKAHHYCRAPFLHVGLFIQHTWQQTGVTPGLQIISDSSRVTVQKVTPPGTQPSLWRIFHHTVLPWCRNKACRASSFTFTSLCIWNWATISVDYSGLIWNDNHAHVAVCWCRS